jgi:anaerobic C4-dicarboxylate transporter
MVSVAERVLRRHPQRITILAPLISYLFTFVSGTGHVAYSSCQSLRKSRIR